MSTEELLSALEEAKKVEAYRWQLLTLAIIKGDKYIVQRSQARLTLAVLHRERLEKQIYGRQ